LLPHRTEQRPKKGFQGRKEKAKKEKIFSHFINFINTFNY
jgi:hypothetical protein